MPSKISSLSRGFCEPLLIRQQANDDPYSNYALACRIVPDDVRQYSRNNVIKITVRTVKGIIATTTLSYQYNNQGLPISVTATGSPVGSKIGGNVEVGKKLTFTYESI